LEKEGRRDDGISEEEEEATCSSVRELPDIMPASEGVTEKRMQ